MIVELTMAGYAPLPWHHVNEANIVELAIKKKKEEKSPLPQAVHKLCYLH